MPQTTATAQGIPRAVASIRRESIRRRRYFLLFNQFSFWIEVNFDFFLSRGDDRAFVAGDACHLPYLFDHMDHRDEDTWHLIDFFIPFGSSFIANVFSYREDFAFWRKGYVGE